MRALALLLLLLLPPLPLRAPAPRTFGGFPPDQKEAFEDYVDELRSTGPTKPPTKESFQKQVIISSEMPLDYDDYCGVAMLEKNVHDRFRCKKEHFFLRIAYEELRQTCSHKFVRCRDGARRCHKTRRHLEAVRCALLRGAAMPDCRYRSAYQQGYALVTCRWQDDIGEVIPERVDGLVEISKKQ